MDPKRPYYLLIIDDDPDHRLLLKIAAMKTGLYSLMGTPADGQEALEVIKKCEDERGRLDLIITDLKMPRMDGIELTKILLQRPSSWDIPIVCFSSSDHPGDERRVLDAGCRAFFSKNENFHQLTAFFRSLEGFVTMPRGT